MSAAQTAIGARKEEHLALSLTRDVEARVSAGYAELRLRHRALPEVDLDEVDPSTSFLGKELAVPVLIGAMTGGTPRAQVLNERLAAVAQERGLGFCLGSQRAMLESSDLAETYDVRHVAPDALVVGNVGAVQLLRGVGAGQVAELASRVGADAMALHLNAAQEALQAGGDVCFAGATWRLAEVVAALDVPCGVKEVGCGLSPEDVELLAAVPLAFIESAGAGGTSWPFIEGSRGGHASSGLGEVFRDWGIPSVTSLRNCVGGSALPVVASGGIRTGVDVAKALALGARCAAISLPFIRAAEEGSVALHSLVDQIETELRIAMFLCGASTPGELRGRVEETRP